MTNGRAQPFLGPTNRKRLLSYEEPADELQVSLGGVKTLIQRLRKRYSEILREEFSRCQRSLKTDSL